MRLLSACRQNCSFSSLDRFSFLSFNSGESRNNDESFSLHQESERDWLAIIGLWSP